MRANGNSFAKQIARWPSYDMDGLIEFIKPRFSTMGTILEERLDFEACWYLATGGWSDNEWIIVYMQKNAVLWATHWRQSKKGGAFWFAKSRAL